MINKNIIALGFVSFFTDMASSMITAILPLFIVYTLHEGCDVDRKKIKSTASMYIMIAPTLS